MRSMHPAVLGAALDARADVDATRDGRTSVTFLQRPRRAATLHGPQVATRREPSGRREGTPRRGGSAPITCEGTRPVAQSLLRLPRWGPGARSPSPTKTKTTEWATSTPPEVSRTVA
jgi:hypothetical protein